MPDQRLPRFKYSISKNPESGQWWLVRYDTYNHVWAGTMAVCPTWQACVDALPLWEL